MLAQWVFEPDSPGLLDFFFSVTLTRAQVLLGRLQSVKYEAELPFVTRLHRPLSL